MRAAFLLILALIATPVMAEQELPEALRDLPPEQLMAVGFGMMQFSDDEKAQFGEIISAFGEDVRGTIASELRRNAPNQQRRIRRKLNNLFDELDERVAPIVGEARRPGFLIFKKGLADQMLPQ